MREDVDAELRFHIEARTARNEETGMTPEDALADARRRFGDINAIGDEVEGIVKKKERATRQSDTVDDLRRDLGFAARQILRNPGFSSIAILTIALAIGSTTSVFSIVDGIMLRPLPFDDPDELVMVWADYSRRDVVLPDKRREWLSWPNFQDFRDGIDGMEATSAFGGWGPTLTGDGTAAERLDGGRFSLGMFSDVLKVEPALGRGFTPEEDRPDGPASVLLSNGLWLRAFGGDPGVLNQTIRLNDEPWTIIGIMPADFRPPAFLGSDLWTTLQLDMSNADGRGGAYLRAAGRIADGASLELVQGQATQLGARLEAEYPEANIDTGFNVYGLQSDLVRGSREALWVLLGAVGCVLLIACVNVANLLLARGTTRQTELSLRVALGAGRRRVLSQLMTESLLLAAIGGGLGVALAFAGTAGLVRLAPAGTPLIEQVSVDGRILGFAALITILTGALFGVLPALKAARTRPGSALRAGWRSSGTASSHRLRNSLVVGQVALALMLLVGAGLLVRSFQNLSDVDLGFEPESVLSMQMQLPQVRYPDATSRIAFFELLEERLEALPGVERAGSITNLPMAGQDGDNTFYVEGAPPARAGLEPAVWLRRSTPGYFEALGLELISGRGFRPSDDADATRVIIVNETLERDFFGGQAIGKRLNVNDPETPVWREVIGVATDIKNFGIRSESRNALYLPYAQAPTGFMYTAMRTSVDPSSLVNPIRAEVAALDPAIALASVQPMEEVVSATLQADRFTTTLLGGFALVALLLAVVGLYGVVSYSVSMRMREMGVRIALGAPQGDIRYLILKWALGLAAGGILIGAAGAFGMTRLMGSLLFGVAATDIPTFAIVSGVMAVAALAASLVPAIRATRVDPIEILKAE
jgi:putative ABC transport system permease protein